MEVIFRVDASIDMGTGHVMRCLTLADELKRLGVKCTFITRAHPGNMADAINQLGHETVLLPKALEAYQSRQEDVNHASWLGVSWEQDAEETVVAMCASRPDWLIVDHYGIDARWHKRLINQVDKIMVIDDLADRAHVCDMLLDQNLGRKASDYIDLVPEHCMILIGPKYALLRPEFAALREYSLQRRKNAKVHRVLITMGGVDQHNATGKVLAALNECQLPIDCRITVVMGQNAPWLDEVKQQAEILPWRTEVLVGIDDMAQRMADSDLAIGAAGSTSWERCCLGLPSLVFFLAENQQLVIAALEKEKISLTMGIPTHENEDAEALCPNIDHLIKKLSSFSSASMQVTNGLGRQLIADLIKR